ncbi:hypothetical protein GMORB2_3076 [Geosmithia morbida]|uniref:Rhodopsin domain-containing protein n=1 Tax=Geosmithia morbida TaxID=1094350 RepID=A0A9P5D1Y6_9HYPO|nr:uncharacterized protein GMORB2_3076 [Geosmithia morbida]KAF4120275.1 hypothetical protein GMORB2_3076 [Geosmithia morbida]
MAAVVNGVPVAIPPPEGYVVDFEHPARNSVPAAYWLFGVGNFLMLIFMLQRVYVRAVIQKTVKLEDAFLGVAYVFSVVLQTLIIRDFVRGIMGTHAWEMSLPKFSSFARALYLLPILYNPVQCGAKMALLVVYRRLAPQRWFHYSLWFTICIVIGSSLAITFVTIFPCKPIRGAWDVTITDVKCINREAVYKATAALGAVTDAMVLAVPIPIVVPLRIPRRQKIGLLFFFSLGGLTVFTSIMRLITLIKSMDTVDQSWGGGPVLLWIFAEANLSVICATLPTIKPFFRKLSPYLVGASSNAASRAGPSINKDTTPTFRGTGTEPVPRYNGYERFDDSPMYPLKTMVNVEVGKADGQDHQQGDSKWTRKPQTSLQRHPDDSGSEKAIVQTRTTTMSYSRR